jgi:hypothetical protein
MMILLLVTDLLSFFRGRVARLLYCEFTTTVGAPSLRSSQGWVPQRINLQQLKSNSEPASPLRARFKNGQGSKQTARSQQHRTRPCKSRKDGAPFFWVLSAKSKPWATRPSPRTPRGGEGPAETAVVNGDSAIPILLHIARKDRPPGGCSGINIANHPWDHVVQQIQ